MRYDGYVKITHFCKRAVLQHGKKELQARGIIPQDCQEHHSNGTKVKLKLAKLALLKRYQQLGENDINNLPWAEVLKELKKTDKGEYIEVKHPDNKGIVKEIIKLSK